MSPTGRNYENERQRCYNNRLDDFYHEDPRYGNNFDQRYEDQRPCYYPGGQHDVVNPGETNYENRRHQFRDPYRSVPQQLEDRRLPNRGVLRRKPVPVHLWRIQFDGENNLNDFLSKVEMFRNFEETSHITHLCWTPMLSTNHRFGFHGKNSRSMMW